MRGVNSDHFFRRADGSTDDNDGIVRAMIVEEAGLVRSMLQESVNEVCDRCLDPFRAIEGIVVFYPVSARQLMHLGKSEWALCDVCLSSLKEMGSPRLIYLAGES